MSASREHWKAKALQNAGERIRRLKAAKADDAVVRANQREIMRQAAEFVADLLGDDAFPNFEGGHPCDYIAWYLNTLSPLFPSLYDTGDFWPDVIDEIARMQFGDEPEIVKPEPRLRGQPVKPALVATRRLRALEWAAYFKSLGARPMHFQQAIRLAFGADWDAIRHWQGSISNVIGKRRVAKALTDAAGGYFIQYRKWHKSICDPLWIDGMFYRVAVGMPEMSEDLIHTEWEKLCAILSVHHEVFAPYS